MAATREQPSGKWQGIAKCPGQPRRTKVFPLKRQALKWAQDLESQWRHGGYRDPRAGRMTLGAWYAIWLPARVVAASTAEREQRTHAKHVLPRWAKAPLDSITRTEVRGWVAAMGREGISPAQIHMAFWALSAMLRDAAEEEPPLIPANPCARVPLPKLPAVSTRFFTHEEVARLLAVMNDPWRTMVALGVTTGLRWEEMAGLHANHVDWLRGQVRVAEALTPAGDRPHLKSESSERTVPAPPEVITAMSALLLGRGPFARVFADPCGGPLKYNTWWWNIRAACRKTGIAPAPPHMLRHTAASWLTEAGVDQYRIQALLGHGSSRMTARYSHLAPGKHGPIREAWAGMPSIFLGADRAQTGRTAGRELDPQASDQQV